MYLKRVWVSRVLTSLTFVAAGCAFAGDDVVAVIDGEYRIKADDLEYYYERALAADEWPVDEDVEAMLRDILNSAADGKVLELEAEERGYADAPFFQSGLDGARSRSLRDRMRQRVEAGVVVTDEEVRYFYEKRGKRRKYSFIEAEDPARAEEAYRALEAGRPWEEVVAEYSTFRGYSGEGGAWEIPMEYGGDEASEALFALEPGEYTRPVEDADGWAWRIYRFDKAVHGSGLSFDEARTDIENMLKARKEQERFDELAAGWREAAPVRRDEELRRRALALPFAEVATSCGGEGVVLSDVGGMPVYFDDVFFTVDKMLYRSPEEVDRIREETPYRYEAVWDSVLSRLEDYALLEWRALEEGIDESPSFKREMAARRAETLVDSLYREEFLPLVREPSPEEIEAYYEGHKEDFYTPERVEVYVVAMPGRQELAAFYGEIKGGADLVVTGEARNRDRERAAQDLYDVPPALPPAEAEWLGVVTVTATPAQDEGATAAPSAEDLRPRVFPFTELHVLSDVFQLPDGRWAFYEPIYYQPPLQRDLEDTEVAYYCRKGVSEEILLSPETAAAAEEWLASMRARHDVVVDEAALAEVAARVREKPRP
jgi:parvulin-like peptidyl-prolyl isomerase